MASFGNDLATIRKRLKISLEDIHNTTKIPLNILQAIEDDSIFSDFDENKTYVRSYIRSYAKTLKLEDDFVVKALDHFEAGTYSGQLLQKNEDSEPDQPVPNSEEDMDEEPPESEDVIDEYIPESTDQEISNHFIQEKVPPPPSISSVDWADMGKKFTPLQTKSRVWVGVIAVFMIIISAIFYWIYQNNPNFWSSTETEIQSSQNVSQTPIVPDSLQLNLTDSNNTNAVITTSGSTDATLPDTLNMLIYAAYNKLEPVRVFTDVMNGLNPYWIEKGEALRFQFVNAIRFRGQYSRMELLVNGHPIGNFYQRFYNSDTRMVEIQRSLFENDNKWLQPSPDSSSLGFAPPSVIHNRPTFN